jgi:cytochrome c2
MLPLIVAAGAALVAAAAIGNSAGRTEANAGEQLYRQCYSCHSLAAGENLPSGPTLYGIVGKAVAAEEGFDYSPALRRFAQQHPRWTPKLLDRFIAEPDAVVPGTYMSFHGLAGPADRSALIAYLGRGR